MVVKNYLKIKHFEVKLFFLISCFFSSFLSLSGANLIWPGSELSLLGKDVEVIALGGVTSGLEEGEYVLDNPALSATQLRKSVTLNVAYMGDPFSISLAYLHPTEYGVFGGSYYQIYNSSTGDFFFSAAPIFAKEISTFFLIGMRINLDYYTDLKSPPESSKMQNLGANADLTLTMKPKYTYEQGVLVVENLIISAGFKNLGLLSWRTVSNEINGAMGEKVSFKGIDLIRGGVGLDFLKSDMEDIGSWKMRAMTDLAITYPINLTYHLGLSSDFKFNEGIDRFSLMLGYFYHPFIKNVFPLSGGFRLDFPLEESKVKIKYAIVAEDSALFHSLTFAIHFGDYDDESPQIDTEFYGDEGILEEGIIE